MKKLSKILWLIIALVVCISAMTMFAGCGIESVEYTVTYYDGETVLKTETVNEGEKAERWIPTKEGYTFVEWFATPDFKHAFSFDDAINENRSVFAQWANANQSVDTRTFYIVGSGTSPILLVNNWGKVFDETTQMTKAADKNEYTYTLDLQEGDLFQFAINSDWHNQRGYGYLDGLTLEDGRVVFSGTGTIGESTAFRQNIKCEYAGNYTFTLTTHPDDDAYETNNASYTEAKKENFNINPLDKITWVRNGDAQEVEQAVVDFYIKGAKITNWKDMYNAATKMTNNEGVYTLNIYLKENEEFMFTSTNTVGNDVSVGTQYLRASNLNEESKEYIGQTASMNMIAKASGTYTFNYDSATEVMSVEFNAEEVPVAADYYIDGTFAEGVADWSGYCFNEYYKLAETEEGSGIYEIKNVALKADSQIIIQVFKAGATERGEWGTPSYNGLGSYNYTYLANGGDKFSAFGGGNNNIKVLVAGNYDITLDSYAKMITIVEHIDSNDTLDLYIKGSGINNWAHGWAEAYLFTISADETKYEYTLVVTVAVEFGIEKHPKGEKEGNGEYLGVSAMGETGDANATFRAETGNNFKCATAGTYKIVYDIESQKIDFYAVVNA